jgi:RNA polymerase sigma factor (sigma-70 family)
MSESPLPMTDPERDAWFLRDVLPLEGMLVRFIQRNWRDSNETMDLCQEVYARVYVAAAKGQPQHLKSFVLTVARNLLIDRARRAQVIPLELVADLEALNAVSDDIAADERTIARDELRRLQAELDRLPPRCREVMVLRKIEGLSQREVAKQMGISEGTVEQHLFRGVQVLADALFGGREAARLNFGGRSSAKVRGS